MTGQEESKGEKAAPYVASFFTSSSEKRSTFTSLWHNVHQASTTSTTRTPTTASVVRARVFTCQKSISSSVEKVLSPSVSPSSPLWGEARLRSRCPCPKPPLSLVTFLGDFATFSRWELPSSVGLINSATTTMWFSCRRKLELYSALYDKQFVRIWVWCVIRYDCLKITRHYSYNTLN